MTQPAHHLPLPETLQEWRKSGWEPKGTRPRDVWNFLGEFFLDQGLVLWKKGSMLNTVPPNDLPRSPDAFAYITSYHDDNQRPPYFCHGKAIHCPARTTDNRDVLIRLVAKGDAGQGHVAALHRLAMGPIALRGENHVVPVLREIVHNDMVFYLFPLMNGGFNSPWLYNLEEVIDAVQQVLEGVAFCHQHLVAHLDLDVDNILINFVGGPTQTTYAHKQPLAAPFRQYFPVRYYINDFELAVCFDQDSEPTTRLVTGLPTAGILEGKYGRDVAPEMLLEERYCPFRADVWQLGRMFSQSFGHLRDLSYPLADLYAEMASQDPLSRPTTAQALERVRELRSALSPQTLATRVARPPPEPYESSDDEVGLGAKPASQGQGVLISHRTLISGSS